MTEPRDDAPEQPPGARVSPEPSPGAGTAPEPQSGPETTAGEPAPAAESQEVQPEPAPTDAEPTGTDPAGTEPAGAEPTGTGPTGVEPTDAEPAERTPADGGPSETALADGDPVETDGGRDRRSEEVQPEDAPAQGVQAGDDADGSADGAPHGGPSAPGAAADERASELTTPPPVYDRAPRPTQEPYQRVGDLPEVPDPQPAPVIPAQGPDEALRFRDPQAGRGWAYPDSSPQRDEAAAGASGLADEAVEPSEPVPGAATPSAPRRSRHVSRLVLVLLLVIALLLGFIAGAFVGREYLADGGTGLPVVSGGEPQDRAPDSVAGIAAVTLESTVYIEAAGQEALSSGTGMVLTADGYIVTNHHVVAGVDGAGSIRVTFSDGTESVGSLVGGTADYDIAVVQVDRDGLVPLVLGDSDSVVVGDPVVAVGAPLGLEGTVTSGIVSALNRPVQAGPGTAESSTFLNAIQTDAAINPGNSGGPLVNTAGEVIGINTAIAQASGQPTGSIGLGFAIPSNQVRRTAEQIIATGEATYPIIGILLDTRYVGEGVRISEDEENPDAQPVTPDGPASEAGLQPGDIVLRFDGQPVTSPAELIVAVRARAPGESIELSVRRGEEEFEVTVELGEAGSE